MSKAEYRQLTFAFADSPQGDGPVVLSDVSVGKAWLSLKAEVKEGNDSAAWTVDLSRLLETVTSASNLAQALLNVARNKGAAGVDGRSVDEVVAAAPRLLPYLRRELLAGTDPETSAGFGYPNLGVGKGGWVSQTSSIAGCSRRFSKRCSPSSSRRFMRAVTVFVRAEVRKLPSTKRRGIWPRVSASRWISTCRSSSTVCTISACCAVWLSG